MPRNRIRRWAVGVVAAALLASSATAGAVPGSPSRLTRLRSQVFAPSSHWYARLPANAPLDPNSRPIIDHIQAQGRAAFSWPNGRPGFAINTTLYSPTLYVASEGDYTEKVNFYNCWGGSSVPRELVAQASPVRIPWGARPAEGSDHEMGVYDPRNDTVYEFWRIGRGANGWSACWGGAIANASKRDGTFAAPYGSTSSGLSLFGGIVRYDELVAGRIDHVVGLGIPHTSPWPSISAPANRTDGYNPSGRVTVAQGQLLRLPADLNLEALNLNRIELAFARAAQQYGFRVWDSAGAISVRAENPLAWGGSQADYDRLYRQVMAGRPAAPDVMANFPFEKLQVVRKDYVPR